MRNAWLLAVVGLVRAPGRTVVRIFTLAAAVGLLAAMLLFIGDSLRTMTSSTLRSVPVDWQGPVGSYGAATSVAARVAKQPGVAEAVAAATAPVSGFEHVSPTVGRIRSGAASILAVPPGYLNRIHTFRFLRGSLGPGGVVLDQQLAATLQAEPGDTVSLTPRRGDRPLRLKVTGVALVTAADQLFRPLNPVLGPGPAQPPAQIAVMELTTFARRVAPAIPAINSAAGAAAAPGPQVGVQWQVQAQLSAGALTGSPAHALGQSTHLRNSVQGALLGQVAFVDNLGDSLTGAASDALYAQTLYIMLALPGALVALSLAYLAGLGTAERDRRGLALLRARGARRRDLILLTAVESLLLGACAGVLGAGIALAAVRMTGSSGHVGAARLIAVCGICVGLAAAGAATARVGASLGAYRAHIGEARRSIRRAGPPLWQRLYLDVAALLVAGLVYRLTVLTGFSAVVNPDSNPTLSLSVYMFLAPGLLWLGSALLLVRMRGRLIVWFAHRITRGRATSPAGFVLASLARRGAALNRGLLVLGLLLAFGVNLGIFVATYNQQARVDARLTLGADVVATGPSAVIAKASVNRRIERLAGVAAVSGLDHSYAYIGPDLQDTFGVDTTTLGKATSLKNSYFLGGSANELMDRLHSMPDGILVSRETVTDYSLQLGDLLRLRVLDHATGRFRVVPFHVVGIVQEFPSAPKDSFMVANLHYLTQVTHDPGPNVLLIRASGDASTVARRVAGATRDLGLHVNDIRRQTAQTVSSITSVDLRGISRIEESFLLVLVAAAISLFVVVAVTERRQEFATMVALGASLGRVSRFVWAEAALVVGVAFALAALLGWLLAEMMVAMLQHVFDPPPDQLAVPWSYFSGLGAVALGVFLLAVALATLRIRALPLGAILREE